MKGKMAIGEFMAECEKLAIFMWPLQPGWIGSKCPNFKINPWDSLQFFCLYGFEHQGTSRDYPLAAYDAIEEVREKPLDEGNAQEAAQEVWEKFKTKLEKTENKGLNCALNPLCPKHTRYRKKNKTYSTKKFSVIELAGGKEIKGKSIFAWVKNLLETDNAAGAHDTLCKINGIGQKISHFFLRDVAIIGEIDKEVKNNRELLQPIDTWLRRVVRLFSDEKNDFACARYLVKEASNANLNPEKVNAGIWYFCARVAGSSLYLVEKCRNDRECFRELLQKHMETIKWMHDKAKEFY
jgi:hypothetical protein